MKFFAKLLLIVLLVPTFVILLLASTIKFQLLNPNFWKDDFKKNNIYTSLSKDLKTYAENQTEKGGGKKSDLKIITDVITPVILEDFVSLNIDNFLGFANGKNKELLVYIPINKIPKEFAPKSVGLDSEQIPFQVLLTKFNIDVSSIPISQTAYFGMSINYLWIGSLSLLILFIFLLFLLTETGNRFISIGVSFVLVGSIFLFSARVFNLLAISIGSNSGNNLRVDEIIMATLVPSVIQQAAKTWSWMGLILLIVGIKFFFFKKSSHNKNH